MFGQIIPGLFLFRIDFRFLYLLQTVGHGLNKYCHVNTLPAQWPGLLNIFVQWQAKHLRIIFLCLPVRHWYVQSLGVSGRHQSMHRGLHLPREILKYPATAAGLYVARMWCLLF